MKKYNIVIALILTGIAFLLLIAAAVIVSTGYLEADRAEQTVEDMRPGSVPSTEETASGAANGNPSNEDPSAGTSSDETASAESNPEGNESPHSNLTGTVPEEAPGTESSPEASAEPERVENPYAASYLANADMAAWLVVPGTVIDYPVMWTPRDENYYLLRDFNGNSSKSGCLLLDTDSCVDPLTTNLIIHGHNMKAGTMFASLMNYEKQSYWEDHREVILHTPECQRNYEVIAVFRSQVFRKSDTVFKFYQFFEAETEEEFQYFYDNIKAMSLYDTGVTASFGDRFITLSTCAYHVENGRFVVVAKEVEPGPYYLPIVP